MCYRQTCSRSLQRPDLMFAHPKRINTIFSYSRPHAYRHRTTCPIVSAHHAIRPHPPLPHTRPEKKTTYPNFPPVLTFIGVLLATPPGPLTVSVLRQLSAPELSVEPCLCPSPFTFALALASFEADLVGLLWLPRSVMLLRARASS